MHEPMNLRLFKLIVLTTTFVLGCQSETTVSEESVTSPSSTQPVLECGDGVLQVSEVCDDGNSRSGDGWRGA